MNTIVNNIALFLKEYQPFTFLTDEELISITSTIGIINVEKNKILFQIEEPLHENFYVMASGVINLTFIADGEEIVLTKCYSGDVFGLRPFFAKNNYMMTAKAREDAVVYAIPVANFKPFVSQNSNVLDFLLENFATNARFSLDHDSNSGGGDGIYSNKTGELQYFQSLSYSKLPLQIKHTELAKDVAQLLTDNLMDSALVIDRDLHPIGIVTDSDFRSKIANGRFPLDSEVFKIMSAPVITVPENISVAEAQLLLLKHNVSHLCVTKDGSTKAIVSGIISKHDIVMAQSNNPGVLIKQIKKALTPKELKQVREKLTELVESSITKNIPIPHIFNITGEINFAIIKRAIEIAILDMGSPPARFCWLSIGSQARKEQLLLTDQDSILVFEDVAEEKYRDVKDYFVQMAKRATSILEKTGFNYCPNNHMGSNLTWCKSLTEWQKQFNSWMIAPGEEFNKIGSIFFDIEMVAGENTIEETLIETIMNNTKNNTLFFDYLGNDALRKSPALTFFKKFNIEEEGQYKGKFDIKNKAIMPLVDAARLFALNIQLKGINNTYLRFKQLSILDPKFAEIYLNCAEAFLVLINIRTLEGLKNDTSGDFVNLEELSKIDKEKLKNALLPMKELEELIKDKFQLTQFS